VVWQGAGRQSAGGCEVLSSQQQDSVSISRNNETIKGGINYKF
jgi:hypothetical protein